jgi:hypothetical protein
MLENTNFWAMNEGSEEVGHLPLPSHGGALATAALLCRETGGSTGESTRGSFPSKTVVLGDYSVVDDEDGWFVEREYILLLFRVRCLSLALAILAEWSCHPKVRYC